MQCRPDGFVATLSFLRPCGPRRRLVRPSQDQEWRSKRVLGEGRGRRSVFRASSGIRLDRPDETLGVGTESSDGGPEVELAPAISLTAALLDEGSVEAIEVNGVVGIDLQSWSPFESMCSNRG